MTGFILRCRYVNPVYCSWSGFRWGIHGLGALISGVQRGFFEVNFVVLGSVSPCTFRGGFLTVSSLAYVLLQCQHWCLVLSAW